MWKENLYEPAEILIREHEIFPIEEHQHSFFEMAYIVSGTGMFHTYGKISEKKEIPYSAGTIFLIPPDTVHCFTIHTYSKYVFLRFTDQYVTECIGKYVAHTLYLPEKTPLVVMSDKEAQTSRQLISFIADEQANRQNFSVYLQQQWLNSLIALIARSFLADNQTVFPADTEETDKALYLLQYIQQHIHQPQMLRIEALCQKFNLSENYIGRYFKRHFQESLQQYISRNRIKMAESLIKDTQLSMKEIAYRTGYSDACHLTKKFQSYYGLSPLKYRKQSVLQKKEQHNSSSDSTLR